VVSFTPRNEILKFSKHFSQTGPSVSLRNPILQTGI